MNTIVSAAAVASATAIPSQDLAAVDGAILTDAPAVDAEIGSDADRAACLARAEEVIDLLRTRYIREGWKIDEEAAQRALAYCRAYAADGSDPDDEREAALNFFFSHGVSLDWVFCGDIAGLICGVAKYSPRANDVVDANLLALAEQYVLAERKSCDLDYKVDEMEGTFSGKNDRAIPATLFWQESDGELGLPSPHSLYIRAQLGTLEDHPVAYESAEDIQQLRGEKWVSTTRSQTEPTPGARARADEIIAAYEEWQTTSKKPPRGYKKAVRERDRANRAYQKLEQEIAKTPARTVRGMFAKLRCAQHYARTSTVDRIDRGGCEEVMALSIFDDVKRWSGDRVAAAEASWLPTFSRSAKAAPSANRASGSLKSQYEIYPMPFFNAERCCTWDVKPTGNYGADCETGRRYAVQFLESCDGTIGWGSIVGQIAGDMIRAGTCGVDPSGQEKVNGIVIGFMGTIGKVLATYMPMVLARCDA